jgi:hypothetical protein
MDCVASDHINHSLPYHLWTCVDISEVDKILFFYYSCDLDSDNRDMAHIWNPFCHPQVGTSCPHHSNINLLNVLLAEFRELHNKIAYKQCSNAILRSWV